MGNAGNIVKGCMSVLYQKAKRDKQWMKLNASERNFSKKFPFGVFEKFPFTFFEVSHKFAVGTKRRYARVEVST